MWTFYILPMPSFPLTIVFNSFYVIHLLFTDVSFLRFNFFTVYLLQLSFFIMAGSKKQGCLKDASI